MPISQQQLVDHDLIIWVDTRQVCVSEFMNLARRTFDNFKFCIWETVSLNWSSDLHCHYLVYTPYLVLRPHVFEIKCEEQLISAIISRGDIRNLDKREKLESLGSYGRSSCET